MISLSHFRGRLVRHHHTFGDVLRALVLLSIVAGAIWLLTNFLIEVVFGPLILHR